MNNSLGSNIILALSVISTGLAIHSPAFHFCLIVRRKENKAAKPRRITLTSLNHSSTPHQTPSSHPPHFTPLPPPSDVWSPHPAFVGHTLTAAPTAPSPPLSEERQLLRKERSRQMMQRRSGGNKTERRLKITPSGSEGTTLCRSHNQSITNPTFLSGVEEPFPQDSTWSSSHGGTALISTSAPSECSTVVSVDRVSNRETLETLAQLHSRIITGKEMHTVYRTSSKDTSNSKPLYEGHAFRSHTFQ